MRKRLEGETTFYSLGVFVDDFLRVSKVKQVEARSPIALAQPSRDMAP